MRGAYRGARCASVDRPSQGRVDAARSGRRGPQPRTRSNMESIAVPSVNAESCMGNLL